MYQGRGLSWLSYCDLLAWKWASRRPGGALQGSYRCSSKALQGALSTSYFAPFARLTICRDFCVSRWYNVIDLGHPSKSRY